MLGELARVLACPGCGSPMEHGGTRFDCSSCAVVLPVVDGWLVDAGVNDGTLDTASRRRVRVYENRVAADLYDVDVRLTSATVWGASVRSQVQFNQRALAAAASAGFAYLDVPVGSGLVLDRAMKWGEVPRLSVVVDLSGEMLARARRRLGDEVAYVRASVERLPFRAGAFGVVHSANGFHLFPHTHRSAVELRRVTADGGTAFITTWVRRDRVLAGAYMAALCRFGYINEPASSGHYEQAFRDSGFEASAGHIEGSLFMWSGTAGHS